MFKYLKKLKAGQQEEKINVYTEVFFFNFKLNHLSAGNF